ncbi:MAG TPA: class I SAM-dependent methyltransferase [Acidimicrobiales bacterium]|nr:class I SAM-dependent methyltransferase [Acidimicrobiales bacterium]
MAYDWELAGRGMWETLRQGRTAARALAISDSRALVRSLFLASAVGSGLLEHLRVRPTAAELAERCGFSRPERLLAWLEVGAEVGELGSVRARAGRDERFRLKGRRARALAGGDRLLEAHYRSMLEYQVGPYSELLALLSEQPGTGRDDLSRYAGDIAEVSLAAEPFVAALVACSVRRVAPDRALDIGCGSGAYSEAVLRSSPTVQLDGLDMSDEVVRRAQGRLSRAGLASRAHLEVGEARQWLAGAARDGRRYQLVMLLNNVYYFARPDRPALYGLVRDVIAPGGELVAVSMDAPGSVAAAHLNFMLRCQAGDASLPRPGELAGDLVAAGYDVVEEARLVPGQPFTGVRARPRKAS